MNSKRTGEQFMSKLSEIEFEAGTTGEWIDIDQACDIFGLDEHDYNQYLEIENKPTRNGNETRLSDVAEALDNRANRRANRELN
jgi:hypothetical protein